MEEEKDDVEDDADHADTRYESKVTDTPWVDFLRIHGSYANAELQGIQVEPAIASVFLL